ncbi:MAG: hypothetical protein ACKO11_02005 [Cuspidothrix sp.]
MSDVLVELSAEEQELLSGGYHYWGHYHHPWRPGRARQQNTQIVNVILPQKRRYQDDYGGGDFVADYGNVGYR